MLLSAFQILPKELIDSIIRNNRSAIMTTVWNLLECKDHKSYNDAFSIVRRVLDLEEDESSLPMMFVKSNELDLKIKYALHNCTGPTKRTVLLLL